MHLKKIEWDSALIDWKFWSNMSSISAKDACWLVCGVDPNFFNNELTKLQYILSDEKKIQIKNCITKVEADIRSGIKIEFDSPWSWVCWAESNGIPVPRPFHKFAYDANIKSIRTYSAKLPLEAITKRLFDWYFKQDSWTYCEAIFLMQGYKPPSDFNGFDEVRTHFPDAYGMLVRGLSVGAIGREIMQAGQKNFIDSPVRWLEWGESKGINFYEYSRLFIPVGQKQNNKVNLATSRKLEIYADWQRRIETTANELISSGKKSIATKKNLAYRLSKEINVEPATIERNTKKTW